MEKWAMFEVSGVRFGGFERSGRKDHHLHDIRWA